MSAGGGGRRSRKREICEEIHHFAAVTFFFEKIGARRVTGAVAQTCRFEWGREDPTLADTLLLSASVDGWVEGQKLWSAITRARAMGKLPSDWYVRLQDAHQEASRAPGRNGLGTAAESR